MRATNPGITARGLKLDPEHPWRHANVGRLLLGSVINWQDVLVRGLQARGFRRFRASHMNLLRHIDVDGTRITEIAERARTSKQAIGQLVATCKAEKLVRILSDPTDRRAKIVTFTAQGRSVIEVERAVMEQMDAQLKILLGEEPFSELRKSLALLSEWGGPYPAKSAKRR